MCGIAGILNFEAKRPVDKDILKKMTNILLHRGPDGEGYFVDNNVGIGHRRLSVIDLATGAQPMTNDKKTIIIVFNGEIYNYIELREELKNLGHRFYTSSDTEVVLKAYEEWGFDCQKRFNGMWAFCIWDALKKHMFLSRDRIGEKPLHYAVYKNTFLFGSEIKSILAYGINCEVAHEMLHIYLSLGYIPAPFTFYNGISKLMPGHFLVVRDQDVIEKKYWDLPDISEKDMRRDEKIICQEFEGYLTDSVKIRMRSDVPYGAFLSGGLDSSCIVAAMSNKSVLPVETFTIGFAENSFDERRLSRQVAEHFHTNHHEELTEPDTFDEALKKILFHFDEPFGDASAINVSHVSHMARKKVKMVLTGDGGDEVLSGYTTYRTEKLTELYTKMPALFRNLFCRITKFVSNHTRNELRYKLNRIHRFLYLSDTSFDKRFASKFSYLNSETIRQLIPNDNQQIMIDDFLSDVFDKCNFRDPFYRLMYFNHKVSLPDDMLAKVDRMSMANSLEARVPFLDHRLIELAYTVDKNIKLPGYELKHLLKKTYGKKLPRSIIKAPKKSFRVPLREWFKNQTFENKLKEIVKSDFGLNQSIISEIVEANKTSKNDYGDFIWRLFVLKGSVHKCISVN